jgi:uncharacterized protein YjdB
MSCAALFVLAACTEVMGLLGGKPVASIAVAPAAATIDVGTVLPVQALALDALGYPQIDRTITWASSDPAIATVVSTGSVTGEVTGVAPGTASITATSEGYSNAVVVTVAPLAIDTIVVSPLSASVTAGQALQLSAVAKDESGGVLTGRTITWSSSNTSLATVSSSGLVTGVAAGIAGITASSEGKLTTATITILAPVTAPVATVTVTPATAGVLVGQTVQLTATPKDAGGAALTGRTVTWASSNTGVASVSSSGVVTGVGAGAATITATSETAQGVSTVTVTTATAPTNPGTVTGLSVASRTDRSVTLSFTEVGDGAGLPASYDVRFMAAPLTWGQATSVTQGTCRTPLAGTAIGAQRSCTVEGLAASTSYQFQLVAFRGTLNVNAVFGSLSNVASGTTTASTAPVASVSISPTSVTLGVGSTQQFSAVLRDAGGSLLTSRAVTWTSSNDLVAAVSSSGLVTALATGTATLTATSEGRSGTATITVALESSSSWANEPAGLSVISDRPWNTLSFTGWGMDDPGVAQMSIVSDATAPLSPTNVYQFLYPQGMAAGAAGGLQWYYLTRNELFIGMYFKYSEGWTQSGSNLTKLFYVYQRVGDNRQASFMIVNGPSAGPWDLRISNEPDGGAWWTQNVNNVRIYPGRWHRLELYMKKASSSSAGDGVVRWWVDGVLAANYESAKLRGDPFSEFHFSPVWGGLGGTKPKNEYLWVDHIYLSGR